MINTGVSPLSKHALDALLGQSVEECHIREREAFDRSTAGTSGLVLFGAGGLGRKILAALRAVGIEPLAFADNKLAGQVVDGVLVLTPSEAASKHGETAAFVVTIWAAWADTMQMQIESLKALGCRTVVSFVPLLWKYPHLLPHVQIDLPSRVLEQKNDVRRCFDIWTDEASRREYIAQLRWRLYGDFETLTPPVSDQYWQKDLISLGEDAVFVDAGAYNGDTVAQFDAFTGGNFRAAYAFEPDPQNLQALHQRLSEMPENVRSRIHIVERAVADTERDISFQGGDGVSSRPGSGDEIVHCIALDKVLPEPPDFIKFDIEGFEPQGLMGSRRLIAERRPVLAVCVYHLQDHLWTVPLLIRSFNSNYHFYLRPHGQIWETVCYAIPSK